MNDLRENGMVLARKRAAQAWCMPETQFPGTGAVTMAWENWRKNLTEPR